MISHITQLEFSLKQIVLHRGIVNNIRQRTKGFDGIQVNKWTDDVNGNGCDENISKDFE